MIDPALRDRVVSIDAVETGGGAATVLPSTGAVLGVQLRGRVRTGEELLSPAGVTGIQRAAREYGYVGPTTSLLVRFTPQGATCLGVPASELANRSVGLDAILPPARANELIERIEGACSAGEAIAILHRFLLDLPFAPDPLVERALRLITASPDEDVLIASVARRLSISERQLERRFLQRVGITPKRFASLRRFEQALELARASPSLASAAQMAGYYDQSHFNREFRRFTGASPGELLRRRR